MTRSLEAWVRAAWTRRGIGGKLLWLGLLPASVFFRVMVSLRNRLYRGGWLGSARLPRPVVSVGNLTVGGTGKTPTAIWLARELGALGHRVAILSRGYGGAGQGRGRGLVDPETAQAMLEGGREGPLPLADEPVMMSLLYNQTVGVDPRRYEAGRELSERNPPPAVFVLDDGFQHRRLARDVDLVLLGSECRGSMLPAGPFREPLSALERADAVLVTGAHDEWKRLLDGHIDASKVFHGALQPTVLVTRLAGEWCEAPLTSISGAKILAVSAIANPASFYGMLQEWEAEIVDTLEFPDHHRFTPADWHEVSRRGHAVEKIVTTEKDLVKLLRYPFAAGSLYALRVEMVVRGKQTLLELISERLFAEPSQGRS